MQFDDVLGKLSPKQRSDNDWRCKCPAHSGTSDDSLSISDSGQDGIALLFCFSGCDYKDITNAIGDNAPAYATPQTKPAYETAVSKPKQKKVITNVYEYTDEDGNYLFEKVRYEPKTFRCRELLQDGSYNWKIKEIRKVIYNLPSVLMSDTVYIVEGEKDADRLVSMGLTGTCNYDGASMAKHKPKWNTEYNESFRDKTVYIIPDNDEPGNAHADHIKHQLTDIATFVKIIELPDLDNGGDLSDWLNKGNDAESLKAICEKKDIAHRWNIKTLHDVPEDRPPTKYIIEPILPVASLNIWYGPSGSKKSLIIKDVCFSILSGANFVPGNLPEMPTISCPILWIDCDNGDDVMEERIAAFRKTRNVSKDAPFYYVSMPKPWPFMGDINSQMDLRLLVEDLNIGLVIIDNLGAIAGDIEENSAKMVQIMAPLRTLTNETRCSVILIHHPRKGGANGGRAGDALRGHSVIEASLDYAVHISSDEETNIVTMQCTKARRFMFDPIKAQWSWTHKSGTYDLDTAWFSAPAWTRGTNAVKDSIWLVLESSPQITQTRLIDQVYDTLQGKQTRSRIKGWLDEMVAIDKVLLVEKGENNAKIYSVIN